jgi:hypothetical protein
MVRRTPPPSPPQPDDTIAALYRVPLAEFIDARNTLAASLRKSGDAGGSARVKALPKPTAPAWALNQVFWRARAEYDRMIRAGDRLRDEQQQMLAGRAVNSREAAQERQAAVRNVVERAAAFLADSGQPPTEAARQRLAVTADALATWGSRPEGYVPGRLERELDPPGFAALASLGTASLRLVKSDRPAPAPAVGGRVTARGPGSRTIGPEAPAPPQDRGRQDAARASQETARAREAARVQEAERKRLTRARQDAEREAHRLASAREHSAAALSRASADLDAAAKEVAALERQLATARAGLERAERVQADAAAAAAAAERACADAEEVAASAKRALETLAEE